MSRDMSWTANTSDGDGDSDGDSDRRRLCTSARVAWAGRGHDRHGNHRCACRQSAQHPSLGAGEALLWQSATRDRRLGLRAGWELGAPGWGRGTQELRAGGAGGPNGRWVSRAGCWWWVVTFPIPGPGDGGDNREMRETLEK